MKQKFTSEKNKYLENKNKSENKTMFNFKISCLMKKSLFKLMMTLAIVFGLSVSAWAQNDGSSPTEPALQFVGAQRTFSVVVSTGNTYTWEVFEYDGGVQTTNLLNATTNAPCTAPDVTGVDQNECVITWTDLAISSASPGYSGTYCVQVTEENTNNLPSDGGSCSTIRRFYVSIIDIDVSVVATNDAGTATWDDATADEDNLDTNADLCGAIFDNGFGAIDNYKDNDGTLDTINTRYVRVNLSITGGPADASSLYWRFNYTIAGTNVALNDELINIGAVATGTIANTDIDNAASATGFMEVAPAASGVVLIPINTYQRWGDNTEDQSFTFSINDGSLVVDMDATDFGGDYTDGGEPNDANHTDNNESETQTIQAPPATSVISVN